MLLFTDRHLAPEGELKRLISHGLCRMFPLHSAPTAKIENTLILCDVDLENLASARLLRLALAVHRSPESLLVFLLRDRGHHSEAQARALGASDTLSGSEGLDAALLTLLQRYPFIKNGSNIVPPEARLAIEDLLDASTWEVSGNYDGIITTGAQAVLDAIESKGIHHWMNEVWSYDDLTYQHCLSVVRCFGADWRRD